MTANILRHLVYIGFLSAAGLAGRSFAQNAEPQSGDPVDRSSTAQDSTTAKQYRANRGTDYYEEPISDERAKQPPSTVDKNAVPDGTAQTLGATGTTTPTGTSGDQGVRKNAPAVETPPPAPGGTMSNDTSTRNPQPQASSETPGQPATIQPRG